MTNQSQAFSDLLQTQIHSATALLDVLRREYAMLNGNDTGDLDAYTQEKTTWVAKLEQLGRDVDVLLHNAGFHNNTAGMRDFISRHEPQRRAELMRLWTEMLAAAELCQRQNTVNGTIIELRHRSIQQLLAALTGQLNTQTYGPQGKTHSSPVSQSLAKA